MSSTRKAHVLPSDQIFLTQMGENIRLAAKQMRITQTELSIKTGLSRLTIRRIFNGSTQVSMGHYLLILGHLGLSSDLVTVAKPKESHPCQNLQN